MILTKNLNGYNNNYTIRISGKIEDKKGMAVQPVLGKTGYLFASLLKEGKTISKRVDKLVAIHWKHNPNPKLKTEIIHLDGIKTNNYPDNLKWATEAQYKAYKVKEKVKAESRGKRTGKGVTLKDTHTGKETHYTSPKEAAAAIGLTPQKLRKAIRSKEKINNYILSYS